MDGKLLTDRELLLRINERLDAIERRLERGDDRFKTLEMNMGISLNALRNLCTIRGFIRDVDEIDRALAAKDIVDSDRDEPTDPGGHPV